MIVTGHGLADLRPHERDRLIIETCAHPEYREGLRGYLLDAERRGGQTPHNLSQARSWHQRYLETGSMLSAPEQAPEQAQVDD